MTDVVTAKPRLGAAIVALLAVAGAAVSGWLAWLHHRVHNDPEYLPVCAVSETVNCLTVAVSPRAVFLGVPVAFFGLAGFGLVLALALPGLDRRRGPGDGAGFVALLGIAFVAVSAILAIVSVFELGVVCPDCIAVYAVSLALAAVAFARVRRRGGWRATLGPDLAALRREPAARLAPWLAFPVALVALRALLTPYWFIPDRSDPRIEEGVDENGRPWLGAREPELVVHEFTDYECPFCRVAHRRLRHVLAENPGRLRIVRHDYARMRCAPNDAELRLSSCELVRAGICAGEQGRFWDWNDAVFTSPKPFKGEARRTYVADMARFLGLDLERLDECLFAPATVERAHEVFREAGRARISETPSYVIDGKTLSQNAAARVIDARL